MAPFALLGSGEFLPWARPVDTWLAETATAPSDRALILPTASASEGRGVFEDWGRKGEAHYGALGLTPEVLPVHERADASDPAIVDRVADARLIFFSGGNPAYLADTLRDTPFWEAVVDAVEHGTGLGGCSAGAMAIGALAPDVFDDRLHGWVPGLGLLPRAFVLAHYDAIEDWSPGATAKMLAKRPPGCVAVGIDEDTALYGDGTRWQVAGAGAAWISDDGVAPAASRSGTELVVHLGDPVA